MISNVGWGKSDKRNSLSNLYKRIWKRTALLNATRITDTYALDPLDPLGCRHLCILVSLTSLTLCWFWTFALQKSKLFQNFFFWGSCYSNSLDIENTVATRNYYFILKNTRWIKIYFFSFFLTPSLATHQREQMQCKQLFSHK